MKRAVVDIGSNSVRLAMIEGGVTLYKELITTRLGEGLTQTGIINDKAIDRTVVALNTFLKKAQTEGAVSFDAFATAAVRSAQNKSSFLNEVKAKCSIEVEVISGDKEARLGILGALKGKDGGIIDVGGASTEVNLQKNGSSLYAKSVDIGTVRAFDMASRDRVRLEKYIQSKLVDYGEVPLVDKNLTIYAIGGTATTMASTKHELEVYDPKITDGTIITVDEAYQMAEKILSLPVEQVRLLKGMEVKRADLIGGGCLILAMVMDKFGIRQITVSESDNIEGYYLEKYNG